MINGTKFPKTVVSYVNEPGHILPLKNGNDKIGKRVLKGEFKDYKIMALTLEERATCPTSCQFYYRRDEPCYGNNMPFAKRYIVDTYLYASIENQLMAFGERVDKGKEKGMMVRLHVLGDFPNIQYLSWWNAWLIEFDWLSIWGYTHRKPWDPIGLAISKMKSEWGPRFRIRWSDEDGLSDSANLVHSVSDFDGIICPEQLGRADSCGSCALCWSTSYDRPIGFIGHKRGAEK